MPELPEDVDELIRRSRSRLDLRPPIEAYDGADDEDEVVQLSVRLSPRLRHDLAEVARRDRTSVTAFVVGALERAVDQAIDPFAGLAAAMTQTFREELGRAVESGAYAEEAAAVDRDEAGDLRP